MENESNEYLPGRLLTFPGRLFGISYLDPLSTPTKTVLRTQRPCRDEKGGSFDESEIKDYYPRH